MDESKEVADALARFLEDEYKPYLDGKFGPKSKFLLLHCIDYRYPKAIHEALDRILPGRYDQVALAGASLAGVIDFPPLAKPHWSLTLLDHVELSMTLPHHEIKSILALEHRTCGAYEKFGLLPSNPPRDVEECEHAKQAERFANLVASTFPMAGLYFDSYLLDVAPVDAKKAGQPIVKELFRSAR